MAIARQSTAYTTGHTQRHVAYLAAPTAANLGEAPLGKLKASTWRHLHSSVLPFAMLQIASERPDVVSNWAHLATAVDIVARRESSSAQTTLFLQSMHSYLRTLKQISPSTAITPMLHSSFHIAHQLGNLAPAASLSTWRPEQFNGILQRTPNNHKLCAYLD